MLRVDDGEVLEDDNEDGAIGGGEDGLMLPPEAANDFTNSLSPPPLSHTL